MDPQERERKINEELDRLSQESGVARKALAGVLHLNVAESGEIMVIDPTTGSRRISPLQGRVYVTADEEVENLRKTRPDLFPQKAKQDDSKVFGIDKTDFARLGPVARSQIARRHGVELPKVGKPSSRTPTAAEQQELSALPPIARTRRARQLGIV